MQTSAGWPDGSTTSTAGAVQNGTDAGVVAVPEGAFAVLLVPSEIAPLAAGCVDEADWPKLAVLLVPSDIDEDDAPIVEFAITVLLVPSAIPPPDEGRRCDARQRSGPESARSMPPGGQDGGPASCWATHCTTTDWPVEGGAVDAAMTERRGSGATTMPKPAGQPRKVSVAAAGAGIARGIWTGPARTVAARTRWRKSIDNPFDLNVGAFSALQAPADRPACVR